MAFSSLLNTDDPLSKSSSMSSPSSSPFIWRVILSFFKELFASSVFSSLSRLSIVLFRIFWVVGSVAASYYFAFSSFESSVSWGKG